MKNLKQTIGVTLLALLLAACSTKPKTPDWQESASDSLKRYTTAYLKGDARVAVAELARARKEVASTGDAGYVARVELTRCAVQLASLVLDACSGFEAVSADSPAAERAYAAYLAGRATPAEIALLPSQHRGIAGGREDVGALPPADDPVARLVAAGVLFRMGRASPQLLDTAVETASQQGWRRPLMAWLGVQLQRAERAGAKDEAERLRRRMAILSGEG